MAIHSTLTFEGQTSGNSPVLGGSWSLQGSGDCVVSSAAAAHGDVGLRWPNMNSFEVLQYTGAGLSGATFVTDMYVVVRSIGANTIVTSILDAAVGGSQVAQIRIMSDRTVQLRSGTTAVATSSPTLTIGSTYRLAWTVNSSGQQLRVYAGEATTALFTLSGGIASTTWGALRIGATASSTAAVDFDTIRLADEALAPYGTAPPVLTGALKSYYVNPQRQLRPFRLVGFDDDGNQPVGALGYIGDSLTYQNGNGTTSNGGSGTAVADSLADQYAPIRVDGQIGRPIVGSASGVSMQDVIDTWRADSFDPATWVLALGSNNLGASDAQWTNWIGQALAKVAEGGGTYTVYWVSIALRDDAADSRVTRFWSVLNAITPPANVTLMPLDFNTAIHAQPQAGLWTTTDETGRHMTAAGYNVRNQVIAQLIAGTDPGPGPGPLYPFWISHNDTQSRPGYPSTFDGFEQALSDAVGQPGPIGAFVRGYSGSNFPSTFQASSVSSALSRGIGAMINVKRPDWQALANGDYDSTIQSFFNSWPTETFGSFTINHEPENDGPSPAAPSNPDYVAWASIQGPIWCQGIARTIAVAAPIIRSRGLDVKLGGCLMDFSWDTTRWQYWDWWNYVDPQYLDVVEFQLDAYTKTVDGSPPRHYDLMPRLVECMGHARTVGIEHFSLFETANDRRQRHGGENIVGNDESVAVFWEEYFDQLKTQIPETRMVAYFSIPTGPASAQAGIMGRGLEVFANGCLNGKRP